MNRPWLEMIFWGTIVGCLSSLIGGFVLLSHGEYLLALALWLCCAIVYRLGSPYIDELHEIFIQERRQNPETDEDPWC